MLNYMVHGSVGCPRERVAGSDAGDGGAGTGAAAFVAPQVVGREAGDGRVVVGVFADILVDGKLLGANAELLEDVVARDVGHAQGEGGEEGGELHGYGRGECLLRMRLRDKKCKTRLEATEEDLAGYKSARVLTRISRPVINIPASAGVWGAWWFTRRPGSSHASHSTRRR